METIERHRSRKKDAGILTLAAAIVALVQGGFSVYVHGLPSADSEAIKSLWAEVHGLSDKIDGVETDVSALKEDGKQDANRDEAIREIDRQLTVIGKAQAADEAILKGKGN